MTVCTVSTHFSLTFLAAISGPLPLATAQNAPRVAQKAQDLSSPEAAIRSFALAMSAKEPGGANCLVGAKIDPSLQAWVQDARRTREVYQVTIVSVQPQVNGDRATAAVTYDVTTGKRQQRLEENLTLEKVGVDWKIAPPTEAEMAGYFKPAETEPSILALFAAAYRYPKQFLAARDVARETDCRSNLQELAQGSLTYTQDSDDKFDFRADGWKAAVAPYVKHASSFRCLSDETDQVAYSFNPQLAGKRVDSIRKPELTVLVYEGKKGVLNFRHHGRAMVALANGKVKSVTAAEARTLRWAP